MFEIKALGNRNLSLNNWNAGEGYEIIYYSDSPIGKQSI